MTRSEKAVKGHLLGCVVLVLSLVPLPAAGRAQSLASGTIGGVAKDPSGGVLPGVTVEAASPALIEKVRTVVTDDQGQYKIVDLRPGTYTVTFTLAGFSTLKREGVELTTGFTATVNAELKVGALEETVTVSGAAPIVDTQNVNQQKVFAREVAEALPTNRTVNQYIALIPGAVYGAGGASAQDVGGNKGEDVQGFQIHGSLVNDFQQLREGMFFGTMVAAGNRMTSVNPAVVDETVVQTSGATAEAESGGALVNIIPRDGGNKLNGSFATNFSNEHLQGNNLDSALQIRGVSSAPVIKQRYDVGGGAGGPIKRDRVWWFGSWRRWVTSDYYPGQFWNATPTSLFFAPDLNHTASSLNYYREVTGRLTVQASKKNKFAGFVTNERNCNCFGGIPAGTNSPEAASDNPYWPSNKGQVTWSYPATNRLLLQAGFVVVDGVWNRRGPSPEYYAIRRVTDSSKNYAYGGHVGPGEQEFGQTNEQFTASYVTGSHSFKAGFQFRSGGRESRDFRGIVSNWSLGLNQILKTDPSDPKWPIGDNVYYTFSGRTPQSITLFAGPLGDHMVQNTVGLYGQDQWTVRRLTLNLGVRFDDFNGYIFPVDLPAGTFVPARHFDEVKNAPNWKDLNPRMGAAYDLFGTGKTAVKAFIGRYVNFESINGITTLLSPPNLIVTSATRTWNDANGDYSPQESELGPLSSNTFGQVVRTTTYADEVTHGFGQRGYSWQISAQLQHELRPGIGFSVGYFRTWYGNFLVTDNQLLTPADYAQYCFAAPVNVALPGGGGNQICGLYDVSPAKFGQTQNVVTHASHYGKQSDIFNGVDITMNARFGRGGIVQGGFSAGSQRTNRCFVVDSPQELYNCAISPPWSASTQLKMSVIYPLPAGLQASATYQNIPPIPTLASYVATNAEILPSLGRNLAACGTRSPCNSTATFDLIRPNSFYQEPRDQQLDIRFSRIFRWNTVRLQPQFDVYNLFNNNQVNAITTRYGTAWRNATTVLGPRTAKVGLQVNF